MVVFDRFMRSAENPDEARLISETSKQIPKDRRVVIVDSDLAYGNARALALDLVKVLEEDELLFVAYDQKGLEWAASNSIPSAIFSTKSTPGSSEIWDKLLRAKVTVYDTHNWWRTRDQLIQRSLLAGSFKVQLWHGATGPVGKVFGLERLNSAPSFWHFTSVATSSTGFDVLVNEPSQAEYRRTRSMLADRSVLDVEYRLVNALNSGTWIKPDETKILIAPTYSESTEGEQALVEWISYAAKFAKRNGWVIEVALHPGAKPRVHRILKKVSGINLLRAAVNTSDLRKYSAVVTDFSGIAHDSLMLGIPTVSVLIDFDNYQEKCPSLIDDEQIAVTYVVNSIEELESKIHEAVTEDSLSEPRNLYVENVVGGLKSLPGVNTRDAILVALDI